MNPEMHKLILDMGFVETSAGMRDLSPEYFHAGRNLTIRPKLSLDRAGLAELLILGGMASQKLETIELIREAAGKLGFKF